MAGEWIKMELSTADKPEVMRMARILGVDRDLVLGKLIRLWAWFDRNSVDGVVDGVVDSDMDDIAMQNGFIDALCQVGWAVYDKENFRVMLTNFDRHNGETAKKRAMKNQAQSKWRNKVKDVDNNDSTEESTNKTQNGLPEKRREEKKVRKTSLPLITLNDYLEKCKRDGTETIPKNDSVFEFVEKAGIPMEYLRVAWLSFRDEFKDKPEKVQKDWVQTFRNYVKNDYLKIWNFDKDNVCYLTAKGKQLMNAYEGDQR
jgi:hypothetical protein